VPVIGTLTVDLVANTASFSGDLGKASNSLDDFGKTAKKAGADVDFSMHEARGSLMLMSEEVGVHIPRHLQALIAEIPGVGAAFAEMLPIVGVVAAIAIIAKLIAKTDEAKEKMAQGWDNFGVTALNVFNSLDDKLLQVGKRADELAGRHLEALHKELLLIDHASLRELAQEFEKLAKAGHTLMTEMKSSWYEITSGSQGASNALTRFTGEYDILLAKGDKKGAFDKLVGTLASANTKLAAMEDAQTKVLIKNDKAVDAQRLLVSILEDQLKVSQDVANINTGEKKNANTEEAQAEQSRQYAVYEEQQKGLSKRFEAEKRYRDEKIKLAKKAAEEEVSLEESQARATEEAIAWGQKRDQAIATEAMKSDIAMAKLTAAGKEQEAKHSLALHQSTVQEAVAAEIKANNEKMQIELNALTAESNLLARFGDQNVVKIQELEDKKKQIIQAAANEETKIREAAAEKQYQDITKAESRMGDAVAKTAASSIMHGKNMAQAFAQTGASMAESALENTLKMLLTHDMQQLSDAKVAAANAYASASAIPFVGPVLAPAAAAAAFAGVMAFEHGGEIPGSGAVPIIGHGGETVVTKALTDQVKNHTGGNAGHTVHIHMGDVSALDSDGISEVLTTHADKIQNHVTEALRRLNN
jgi:hypothetical protein